MRYAALATDYDGTLAHDGVVDATTIASLEALRASGRALVMVTGRELADLFRVFPRADLFDAIVAENGAVLHAPRTGVSRALATPPPPAFADALVARGVPTSRGRVIVATWQPHEAIVLETIRAMGLELQVVFNKGAVMVLPSGTNKRTGLAAALLELGLSPRNTVGVGDAENDHAFLAACECGVAVANALPSVKAEADVVTRADHGAGVAELARRLVESDLAEVPLPRRAIVLAGDRGGREIRVPPYGESLLFAGGDAAERAARARAFVERVVAAGYQVCALRPEGDRGGPIAGAAPIGAVESAPTVAEIVHLLENPTRSVSVNLRGLARSARPAFAAALLAALAPLRARRGRPHWLVLDDAEALVPAHGGAPVPLPEGPSPIVCVTADPSSLAPEVRAKIAAAPLGVTGT